MPKKNIKLEDNWKVVEIKKHSSLIQIDNRKMSYYSKKMFNWIIYVVKKQLQKDPNRRVFDFTIWEIKHITWINQTNHNILKECLISMKKVDIEYNLLNKDKKQIWGLMSLFSEIKYTIDWDTQRGFTWEVWKTGYFSIELPETIRDSILNPEVFAKLNLFLLKWLSTKYSINLYEFLKDYEWKKDWNWIISVKVDILKQIIWVEEKKYIDFSMFKRRVIEPALEQINQIADINVSYKAKKEWKKYTYIEFFISSIKKEKTEKKVELDTEMEMKLKNYFMLWIKQIKEVVWRYKDNSLLDKRLEQIEVDYKKWKISNIWPYTYKVLMESSMAERSLFDIEIAEDKEQKKIQEELEIQKKQEEQRKRREQEENIKKQAEEYYYWLPEEEKKALLKEYESSLNDIMKKQYQRYWIESLLFKWLFLFFVFSKINK